MAFGKWESLTIMMSPKSSDASVDEVLCNGIEEGALTCAQESCSICKP